MVAPPKRRAPHKAIHYRTRDKGVFRNGSKSAGGEGEVDGDAEATKDNNNQKDHQRGSSASSSSSSPSQTLNTSKHNQRLLDIFRTTFYELLTSSEFTPKLQAVKQALFERDFARAFGEPENLDVYAARWSPTRALCYASILAGIKPQLEAITTSTTSSLPPTTTAAAAAAAAAASSDTQDPQPQPQDEQQSSSSPSPSPSPSPSSYSSNLHVLSIGGCAAELVAFASLLSAHLPPSTSGSLTLVDSAPWSAVIDSLTETILTPPPVSKYASAAVKARGPEPALIHPRSRLASSEFLQRDVLALGAKGLLSPLLLGSGGGPLLVTLFFTLNELFTAGGVGETTKFLLDLTSVVPFGSLLLVVDSPGSYSETTLGKEAKRYPMQWLLDRIMLGTQREPVAGRRWKKLESHDSIWFRLNGEGLDYPIPLENMRYQMHLYKVFDASLSEQDSNDDE